MLSFQERVFRLVAQIPYGHVTSYGAIAAMLGYPYAARQVGWAMRNCPGHLPWQRVVRKDGTVVGGLHASARREMLEAEGVCFLPDGRVDMLSCQWQVSEQQ